MKKALALLVVAIALSYSGCSLFYGKDGDVYLKVTSSYGLCAGFDSGLGLGKGWYRDTNYQVNAGTYDYAYTLASYYGLTSKGYFYYINAMSSGYGYSYGTKVGEDSAAVDGYSNGYYYPDQIAVDANAGALFSDGVDRYYTLSLGWSTSGTILSDNKGVLASKVILDNDEKTVTKFTSAHDTITITHNKKPVEGPLPGNLDVMSHPAIEAPSMPVKQLASNQ
jgi:hypothetical protein